MQNSRPAARWGLGALLVIIPMLLNGCPTGGDDGGGGGGGGGGLSNLPPTVLLSSDVVRGVAPLVVRFSSSGSTDDGVIVERRWDFGDGGTSLEISPVHIYQATGEFTVTLTLTDDGSAAASKTLTVSVTEAPVAIIRVDTTVAPSAPATIHFDGSDSFDPDADVGEVLTFAWDFGDGIRASDAELDHVFARSGTFRAQLTVTDATGVIGTDTQIIEVGIPEPQIELRSPPAGLTNIALPTNAPLWSHVVYESQPGVPRSVRAGLDRDLDACDAQTVLFDTRTSELVFRLTGQGGPVRDAVISPDGERLLSVGDDGFALLYDTFTGVLLRRYNLGYGPLGAVAYSTDGTQFAVGASNGTVAVLNAAEADGAPLIQTLLGHTGAVGSVQFSPDGANLLSGDDDGDAILWRLLDGAELRRFVHEVAGQRLIVYDVAFWPTNMDNIATAAEDDTARLWSVNDGAVTQVFGPVFSGGTQIAGHTGAVRGLAFSSNGLRLATASEDGTAKIWDVLTGAEIRTFTGHAGAVLAVAFSPNTQQIITGSADGTARIWDVASTSLVREIEPCLSSVVAVQFTPDGEQALAAVAAENDIQLDTDPPQGNDLNLTLPTALELTAVPSAAGGRIYHFWAEIDTDQTTPTRTYSPALIRVIPPLGKAIATAPLVDLGDDDDVVVIVPPTPPATPAPRRFVFDIGAVARGDRILVNLITTPGYAERFDWPGFSVELIDNDVTMFAWYQDVMTVLDPTQKLVVAHDTAHFYVSVDSDGSDFLASVRVRVDRNYAAGPTPRHQVVFLQFDEVDAVSIGGSVPVGLQAFDVAPPAASSDVVKGAIRDRLINLFAAYDVEIITSDDAAEPIMPHITIYFDTDDPSELLTFGGVFEFELMQYGLPDVEDVRNDTLAGRAIVVTTPLLTEVAGINTDNLKGTAIGNAVAHQIGLLLGLRETIGAATDVMGANSDLGSAVLTFSVPAPFPNLAPVGGITPLSRQNANTLLLDVVGAP